MKTIYKISLTVILTIGIAAFFYNKNTALTERDIYEDYLAQEYRKIAGTMTPEIDNPEMAALQDYYMTINPETKEVPRLQLLKSWIKSKKAYKSTQDDIDWNFVPTYMGGRVRTIMWDPNDANHNRIFAGSVTGGLWKNNDIMNFSSPWENINDFMPSLSISSLTYDPNNTQIFYAGTGEAQTARVIYRESGGIGIGIWKSPDGGSTWELLPSTSEFKYITDIRVRNENGTSVIYAGVVSGIYHGEHQSQPSEGLYRSTDEGTTWTQVLPIHSGGKPFAPADIEIAANGRIFVGTMKNEDGDGGATILFSDTGLPGSWTVYDDYEAIIQGSSGNNIPGRVILAAAPSDANRIYALIGAGYINPSTGFNYAFGRNILKSVNNGASWTETNMPPAGGNGFASLSWHAFAASVSPTDPDVLFVGGLDMWRSNNAGNSWSKLSDWVDMYYGGGDEYVHGDQHCEIFNPTNPNEMVLSTDGGVFITNNPFDNNVVFEERSKGLDNLLFYTCDIFNGSGSVNYLGGLQDNGTLRYTGSPLTLYEMVSGGDGAYCFFDMLMQNSFITSVYYNRWYTFENGFNYDYSDFGSGVFINPTDYDKLNHILYANACSFSGNMNNQLLRIKNIPSLNNNSYITLNTDLDVYFSHIRVSPHSPSNHTTLFVGSQNGKLFKITNAESTPVTSEIGSDLFPTAYISSIAVGGSEDTLLVTFSNYGVPSVWQTYDGGAAWTDISEGLPDMPVRWAIYHPETSKNIMLATEIGIWKSIDGTSWQQDQNFPNVRVDMIKVRATDNMVLAASHGRGLINGVWHPTFVGIENHEHKSYTVFPNPVRDQLHIQGEVRGANISIFDMQGKRVLQSTENNINVSTLASGEYLVKIKFKKHVYTTKILKK
jgi:hypothetical protein